jgi:hypothetical protein
LGQNNNYTANELRFWLQIMGDHARFIKSSLNPDQTNLVMIAGNFIEVYDRLLEKVRQLSAVKEPHLTEITQLTLSLRDFKRELLADRLKNLPTTVLPPTFYNHMLNELEDFLKVLADIETGGQNQGSIIGQHLLWSLDAAAHATSIGSDLDKVEYKLQEIAKKFEQSFDHFYIKAVEITGYFRSCPPSILPVLEAYNIQMTDQMKGFMIYLEDLKKGVIQQRVFGRLEPLVPDHMYREECYYLCKIAEFQPNLQIPDCDPGRPRVMG